jgi:hypothetical protein
MWNMLGGLCFNHALTRDFALLNISHHARGFINTAAPARWETEPNRNQPFQRLIRFDDKLLKQFLRRERVLPPG